MLRLVACDLDGTLMPKSNTEPSNEVIDTIRYVTDKGVYFAVCSGRNYYELRRLFDRVHNRIIYISHDGALAMYRNCVLFKRPLLKSELEAVVRKEARNCEGVLLAGKERSYCPTYNDALYTRLKDIYKESIAKTENLNAMGEELLKVCYYKYNGRVSVPEGMRIAYNDDEWLEMTCGQADKGRALKAVCTRLGIDLNQVVAFGDGENDIPMFNIAGLKYAVNPKCDELIKIADGTINDISHKIKEII